LPPTHNLAVVRKSHAPEVYKVSDDKIEPQLSKGGIERTRNEQEEQKMLFRNSLQNFKLSAT